MHHITETITVLSELVLWAFRFKLSHPCLYVHELLMLPFHTTLLLENVEHCGGEPEQAANMHMKD